MTKKKKIYYECHGNGEPLILISGLNTDHYFWTAVLPYLKNNFRLIILDNRGIGNSKIFSPKCTTALMAKDILHILDDLNIQKSHIVGHSLGGCIAQQIAILHPERVKNLILCSTQAKSNIESKMTIQTIIKLMRMNISRELIIKLVISRLYSNEFLNDKNRLKKIIKLSLNRSAEESRRCYIYQANAVFTHDTLKDLNKILAPTLVLAGEDDLIAPIKCAKLLNNSIKNSKITIVPNMAHMLPIEKPAFFSNCVLDFLR